MKMTNNDYRRLQPYLQFVSKVGLPVGKTGLKKGHLYAFSYIWKESENKPANFYAEYDFFPLGFVSRERARKSDNHMYYQGINLHHLPYKVRELIIAGKTSGNEKGIETALRRYIPSSIGKAFMIPKKHWAEIIRFTANTYNAPGVSYQSRFGPPPKFEDFYRQDAELTEGSSYKDLYYNL